MRQGADQLVVWCDYIAVSFVWLCVDYMISTSAESNNSLFLPLAS